MDGSRVCIKRGVAGGYKEKEVNREVETMDVLPGR